MKALFTEEGYIYIYIYIYKSNKVGDHSQG